MRFLGGGSSQPVTTSDDTDAGQTSRQTVPANQVALQYWGLWEPNEVMQEVFDEFEQQNPGMSIQYTKQSHKDYRERLQSAIASGQGPDVFRFHASWTPMLRAELSPLPSSVVSANQFKQDYYPVVSQQVQSNGQPVGIPLMYDGLVLLYNKEIFDTAGESPPQTWSELKTLASKLTIRADSEIKRGGVALGNSTNVEHFSDILAVLMLQNGADLTKPNSKEVRDALLFYTSFVTGDKVWNDTLPASSVAFARGDVAMIFAPSWRIHEIYANNPDIQIGVSPLPRLSDKRVAWASYWVEGISVQSKNKDAAAKFLQYMGSAEVLEKLYSDASQVRSFGELYPRVDMANDLADNELIAPYLQDAPYAQGWYLSSATHDNGINDQLIKYYEDAITAVVGGKSPDEVLTTVDQGTRQVLRQYGVSTTQSTQTSQAVQ